MGAPDRPDTVLLEGIQIPAALGVTSAERKLRRPVLLDLEIGRDLRVSGRSDQIGDTLDYGAVYDLVEEVVTGREHELVEALGQRIADAVLASFDAEWITITVRKPNPLQATLDHVGIRITRER